MEKPLAILALTAWSALGPAHCSALDAAGRPAAPQKIAEEAIFWEDKGHSRALFVAEPILNSVPVAELPLPDSNREWLETLLKPVPATPFLPPNLRRTSPCATDVHSGGPPRSDAVILTEFLRTGRSPFLVLGRVVAVIPGYNVAYRYVSSMIKIETEEILKQPTNWLRAGEQVFYEQKHGSIQVLGHHLCTASAHQEYFRAAIGQRVLVSGFGPGEDGRIFWGAFAWPVTADGMVLPEPSSGILPEGPVSLESIREALSQGSLP